MKIESIIKRDPPTEIDLDGTVYKFKPDEHGRHVAEVTDKHHIARLLSISEGYQLADDQQQLPKSVQTELDRELEERAKAQQPQVLAPVEYTGLRGSTVHPATIDLGDGEQTSIDDVIAEAHQRSGLTTEEWNALPDEVRHNLIDAELDIMSGEDDDQQDGDDNQDQGGDQQTPPPAPAEDKPAEKPADDKAQHDAERDAVAQEYKAKFGKLPHYKWTIEKIREELAKPAPEQEGE